MTDSTQIYSTAKQKKILKQSFKQYYDNLSKLSDSTKLEMETCFKKIHEQILAKNLEQGTFYAKKLESLTAMHLSKSPLRQITDLILSIGCALLIALIVRACWFELYEIPTGSMRPTFKEKDHLTVTKTTFGLNIPLQTDHFFFNKELVKRGGIVIWSGDKIAHLNSQDSFFGIPYTKRFIKRCMALPGDTVYFYGGIVYTMDENGNDVTALGNNKLLEKIDHVPFTSFDGRRSYQQIPDSNITNQVVFNFLNRPLGRIKLGEESARAEIFDGQKWIKEADYNEENFSYANFLGIKNFAISRILKQNQVKELTGIDPLVYGSKDTGSLFLEMRHTPSLMHPKPLFSNRYGISLPGFSSIIKLEQAQLDSIMDNMYTCRFIIKDGYGYPYSVNGISKTGQIFAPKFNDVENGTYEFYYGKAYKIGFAGIPQELPKDHALYSRSKENILKLYNLGIEMSTLVEPQEPGQQLLPSRYTYFKDGSLYTLGGKLFDKTDDILQKFNQIEQQQQQKSDSKNPYLAFKDYGPPVNKEGKLNKTLMAKYGFKIPPGHYLMLGDNHAMSQDSRWFGPVPQANLQGTPSIIIWPPGRMGLPLEKPYALFSPARITVWIVAIILFLIWLYFTRKRKKLLDKIIDSKD